MAFYSSALLLITSLLLIALFFLVPRYSWFLPLFKDGEYEDAFTDACFQSYLVTLRVKAEMVNDEMRIKNTIQRMTPIDLKTECDALLDAISKYN